jgi:hypothetical protein
LDEDRYFLPRTEPSVESVQLDVVQDLNPNGSPLHAKPNLGTFENCDSKAEGVFVTILARNLPGPNLVWICTVNPSNLTGFEPEAEDSS